MTPHIPTSTARLKAWCRRDAGSATITTAILFPAVGLLVLALVQAALVSVARDVALAAAEEGLRVARAYEHTPAQGRAAALAFADAEPVLRAPSVTLSAGTTVTVRVNGQAPSLLPGVHIGISRTARGAHERFTVEAREPTRSGEPPKLNPGGVVPDG
ncbi:pilus assembly protein [Actinomadura spongiicola]|uniref:Pilus assembly protein n=1 Tax=Actinomadura spongiicola TaxID=2303421 RepID=A0A372GKN9_9ACTN|nr:TadE family protein [Actinomadura spongiicola]RFS85956.1 pilus assembly protein [Actinomadura spongiicola]